MHVYMDLTSTCTSAFSPLLNNRSLTNSLTSTCTLYLHKPVDVHLHIPCKYCKFTYTSTSTPHNTCKSTCVSTCRSACTLHLHVHQYVHLNKYLQVNLHVHLSTCNLHLCVHVHLHTHPHTPYIFMYLTSAITSTCTLRPLTCIVETLEKLLIHGSKWENQSVSR